MNYIDLIAEDRSLITYRPSLNKMTGSVTATILLQQILYWESKSGGQFFKFKQPCRHKMYRDGDSWCEELAFSRREFDGGLKLIGCQRKSDDLIKEMNSEEKETYRERLKTAFIIYWTDTDRKTWYIVQKATLGKALSALYLKCESGVTKSTERSLPKGVNDLSLLQETTQENNQEINTDILEQIDTIYDAYPRKKEKPEAMKEIYKALKKVDYDFLLQKVKDYAISRTDEDPQYTSYPVKWFSKEQWNDEDDPNFKKTNNVKQSGAKEITKEDQERMMACELS